MSLINSLHSFFLKLSRPATIAAITVIALLFLWLINFQGVPGIPPIASLLRIGLPDMMFAYSPCTIYEKLVLFGADGRSAYRIFLERVDFLFPAVYGLFFVTVATFGFSALFPNRPALQKLSLLPLLTTLFDYAENLCFLAILRSFPVELPGKARQRIHLRQVDFRRSQYRIVVRGNFGFADSQSSSSSFCLRLGQDSNSNSHTGAHLCMPEPMGTLIVTGGSRGIGAAISRLAAARGYAVAVNYHSDNSSADALVQEIHRSGAQATAIQADIGQERDILRLFETSDKTLGPLSALVNNAAITGGFARVDSLEASMLERLLAVNVTGAILCAREAVRRLSTKHGGRGGAIVNISSRAAQLGSPGEWVHYAMTKGAIDTLTIGLAREVATEGIRVNAVAPGLVDTGLHAAAGEPGRLARLIPTVPMGRPGIPDEIAEGVLWLLSPAASFVTGSILAMGGGR